VAQVTSGLWTAAERDGAARLVEDLLAVPVLTRARAATERFAELPFVLHYQGRLLEGVIDLAFVEEGAWIIVNCETDTVTTAEAERRADAYRSQLCLSALALEQLTDRPVKDLVLLFVRSQQAVTFTWSENEGAL